MQATVFVVDDDSAVRESLRWLLESVGLHVETYASAQSFLDSCDRQRPGCLILDVRMPGLSGLELQERLAALGIQIPIIIISGHADVPTAVRALKAGAVEFIEKPFSDQFLLERVHQSLEADAERRRVQTVQDEIAARLALLTLREREVFERVVAGKANKQIADELGLSQKTVEVHRAAVMRKMQADSLPELVRLAVAIGRGNP